MGADQEELTHLKRLGEALISQGFTAQLAGSNTTRPYLKVANGETPRLNGCVQAAQAADGSWCYWWPWRQPIGAVDDLETVIGKIASVLRSVEGSA